MAKKSKTDIITDLDRLEASLAGARNEMTHAKDQVKVIAAEAPGYARTEAKIIKIHGMIKDVQKAFSDKAVADKKAIRVNTTEGKLVTAVKRLAKKHGLQITFQESYIDLTDGMIDVEIAKDAGYKKYIVMENFADQVEARINEITGKVFKLTLSNPNAAEGIHALRFQFA